MVVGGLCCCKNCDRFEVCFAECGTILDTVCLAGASGRKLVLSRCFCPSASVASRSCRRGCHYLSHAGAFRPDRHMVYRQAVRTTLFFVGYDCARILKPSLRRYPRYILDDNTTNSYEFTGREDDDGTVYYYRARYYNTYLQRFLSQDPIEFSSGFNLYAYALNQPTALRDPLGLWVAGAGLNFGVGLAGAGASATSEIVWDGKGNVGTATTTCVGGTAAVAAGGGGLAVSFNPQASTIFDLQGASAETGFAFPTGEGVGAGATVSVQNNRCSKEIAGYNAYLGAAGSWPPVSPPVTLNSLSPSGFGCQTTVKPISWNFSGSLGAGGVPLFAPVP